MAGKWHLGYSTQYSPASAGFKHSWALEDGGGNHFDGRGFMAEDSRYYDDGNLTSWPARQYSTDFYTDKIISYLEKDKKEDKPFFIYAAYTSPHWPLQVPEDELNRYKGAYDEGYEALRKENLQNLKKAGLIPENQTLSELHPTVQPWRSLTADEQARESRQMELYAAMVSNLDDNIGRLLEYLAERGELENTLIVFMGDNGAAPSDLYNRGPFVKALRNKYNNDDLADYGKADTFLSLSYPWAEASAPFKYTKGYTTEGGIRAPFIAAGPMVRDDSVNSAYFTVMDLAPTFLALAGTTYPQNQKHQLLGTSLVPMFSGETASAHADDYVTVLDHNNRALVRQGNWKLVAQEDSYAENGFALYNLMDDPAESVDVKDDFPDFYHSLIAAWQNKTQQYGIKAIPDKVMMK